jgi:hypothetical protein
LFGGLSDTHPVITAATLTHRGKANNRGWTIDIISPWCSSVGFNMMSAGALRGLFFLVGIMLLVLRGLFFLVDMSLPVSTFSSHLLFQLLSFSCWAHCPYLLLSFFHGSVAVGCSVGTLATLHCRRLTGTNSLALLLFVVVVCCR